MTEKIQTVGVILMLLFTVLAVAQGGNASAIEIVTVTFGGGTGTLQDPFIIENVHDLQNMSTDLTANYALGNHIDAYETSEWNDGAGFEPVGFDWNNRFTGTFDGRNHSVVGLYINRPGSNYMGLFGYVNDSAVVTQVLLVDVIITGEDNTGGLVGINYGVVSHIHVNGSVIGKNNTGGLAGTNYGLIENSYTSIDVNGSYRTGGVVGDNRRTMADCYFDGKVLGDWFVGGIAGQNIDMAGYSNITHSHAAGTVEGDVYVGGILGLNGGNGVVIGSHAAVNVSGNENTGGLVGRNQGGGLSTDLMRPGMFTARMIRVASWDTPTM